MMNRIALVCRIELVGVARLRWIRLFAAAFALMTVGVAWSTGAARDLTGVDGFARTTVALVPLVLLLVPLVAMLLGVTGQTAEPGSDAFLYALPLTRFEILLGRWLGEGAALGGALAAGFGAGAAVVALGAGFVDLPRFLVFAAATFALALAFLALAALVAALVERRVVALATAAFIWFFFVLLFDAAALAAAAWLTGRTGTRLLMLSVFANPADLMRVLTLSLAGTPHLLGAAGESWHRFLGGPAWAACLACAGLAAWTGVPLLAAGVAMRRRDL
jgi:Cu-processing system permease protein